MAQITLTDLWLHDSNNLASSIRIPLNKLQSVENSVEGTVRRYANGRLRYIRRPGDKDTLAVQLVMVPQATFEAIRAWSGKELMMRDPKGRKVFGIYGSVSANEQAGPTEYVRGVSFSFEEITDSEEV